MSERIYRLRDAYADRVVETMRDVLDERLPSSSTLVEMANYQLDTGGKRLRAILPLAVAEILDDAVDSLIPFGAACELLHNATLVHDDLQDGDATRRDAPSVWSKFGEARAVNLGDAMLYWPLVALERLDVPDRQFRSIVGRFSRQTLRVIEGQEREFELMASEKPTFDEYVRMARGKTSSLFVLAAVGAAELLDCEAERVAALEDATDNLGVLFQIQDDVLDLYGDKGRDEPGADIREGKMSALAVAYLEDADPDEQRWLRNLLEADRERTDRDEIERVAEAFRESGALDRALGAIDAHERRATEALPADDPLADLVSELAEVVVEPIAHVRSNERGDSNPSLEAT